MLLPMLWGRLSSSEEGNRKWLRVSFIEGVVQVAREVEDVYLESFDVATSEADVEWEEFLAELSGSLSERVDWFVDDDVWWGYDVEICGVTEGHFVDVASKFGREAEEWRVGFGGGAGLEDCMSGLEEFVSGVGFLLADGERILAAISLAHHVVEFGGGVVEVMECEVDGEGLGAVMAEGE